MEPASKPQPVQRQMGVRGHLDAWHREVEMLGAGVVKETQISTVQRLMRAYDKSDYSVIRRELGRDDLVYTKIDELKEIVDRTIQVLREEPPVTRRDLHPGGHESTQWTF